MSFVSDIEVTRWGARARTVFRTLTGLYVILWLTAGLLALSEWIFDTDLSGDGALTWLNVVFYSLVAIGVVSGLIWLAGAVVAGYREPQEK